MLLFPIKYFKKAAPQPSAKERGHLPT
jgi:hypothetical protein